MAAPSTARATSAALVTGAYSGTTWPTAPIDLRNSAASVSRTATRTTWPAAASRLTT